MSVHYLRNISGALLFLLAPLGASASVVFTEIMYDAPGADTAHEWVEIQNTGNAPVDLKGWKFFEGGVNHKITPTTGSLIGAGNYAVIANSTKNFSGDWPAFTGTLFGSSFSLNNTSETIALRDASSSPMASVTYEQSSGGAGNGNTLNFVYGAWKERAPSPGGPAMINIIAPPPKVSGNVSTASKVRGADGAGGSKKGLSGAIPIMKSSSGGGSDLASADALAGPTGAHPFDILPWVAGLFALAGVGIAATLLTGRKKTSDSKDEYTIIEDNS